ncbi:pentapeptide repeat-containing protein [Candidatus Pacearchaeota archaeon]|nr:pentapeptide repeat-containing protein [Candidatus Pacearchaeota archaeon]
MTSSAAFSSPNFSSANFSSANFSSANLSSAAFSSANFSSAVFSSTTSSVVSFSKFFCDSDSSIVSSALATLTCASISARISLILTPAMVI